MPDYDEEEYDQSVIDRLKRILRIPRKPKDEAKKDEWARNAAASYYHKYLRGKISANKYTNFLKEIEPDQSISPHTKDVIYDSYVEAMKMRNEDRKIRKKEAEIDKWGREIDEMANEDRKKEAEIDKWGREIDEMAKEEMIALRRAREKGKTPEITDDALTRSSIFQKRASREAKKAETIDYPNTGQFFEATAKQAGFKGWGRGREKLRMSVAAKRKIMGDGTRGKRLKKWVKEPSEQEEGTTSLLHSAGRRVKPRIYEALIFVLIGLFLLVGTPFFGLPSFFYLAFAFIVTIPAYILLPGRYEVLSSIGEGNVIDRRGWALFPKSLMKIVTFVLIIFEFFMINRLVSLVIAFVFYFFLPTRYKTNKPDQIMEAWIRMGFGVYLAIIFFMTFGGNTVGTSLLLMGLAFFATFPIHIEADEDDSKVQIRIVQGYGKATKTGAFSIIDKFSFLVLMLLALYLFGFSWSPSPVQMMFYLIWGLSFFVGLVAGPEAKPALGALTILIALFAFSSTYTGVVGEAIFGYWWPQVQSFTESFGAPLADMWTQAQDQMELAWLYMTDPQAAIIRQNTDKQIKQSITGGTKQSIELSRYELFSFVLDPDKETLLGTVELENQGEFNADYIRLELSALWKDPEDETAKLEEPIPVTIQTTCSENAGSGNVCSWNERTNPDGSERPAAYPTEIKFASFKIDDWGFLAQCCDAEAEDCETSITSCIMGTKYVHGGQTVKIRASYDYNYNVNVSMPVDVIPMEEYERLLRAREIQLVELTSEYSGGPVKATIYTLRQPIRNRDTSLIRVSLVNEGNGNITEITYFTIYVPQILFGDEGPQSLDSSTFTSCTGWQGPDGNNNMFITCEYTPDNINYPEIEHNKFRTATFTISPDSVDQTQISTSILGVASYKYRTSKDINIPIAPGPFGG